MSNDNDRREMLSIGEASQKIDLPESTIRYYDKEFGDYLSIPRGKNNQRLFDEEHLQDLEYIRYLIKREELSIEEVRSRLNREKDYRESSPPDEETDDPSEGPTTAPGHDRPSSTDGDGDVVSRLKEIGEFLERIDDRLNELEDRQDRIEELLDMNLRRYNKLVEDL